MKKLIMAAAFAVVSSGATPVVAYEYTGHTITMPASVSSWPVWEVVVMEPGDDSVGWPCQWWLNATAYLGHRVTLADCINAATMQSGIVDHYHLPVGFRLIVPSYSPDAIVAYERRYADPYTTFVLVPDFDAFRLHVDSRMDSIEQMANEAKAVAEATQSAVNVERSTRADQDEWLANQIADLQTAQTEHGTEFNKLSERVEATEGRMNEFDTTVGELTERLDGVEKRVEGLGNTPTIDKPVVSLSWRALTDSNVVRGVLGLLGVMVVLFVVWLIIRWSHRKADSDTGRSAPEQHPPAPAPPQPDELESRFKTVEDRIDTLQKSTGEAQDKLTQGIEELKDSNKAIVQGMQGLQRNVGDLPSKAYVDAQVRKTASSNTPSLSEPEVVTVEDDKGAKSQITYEGTADHEYVVSPYTKKRILRRRAAEDAREKFTKQGLPT